MPICTDYWCLKLRGFSWKRGIRYFAAKAALHHLSELTSRICLRDLPTGLNCHPTDSYPNLLRHPIAAPTSAGILTCFPSTTPLGLALGSDSPSADYRCAGNLGLTANRFRSEEHTSELQSIMRISYAVFCLKQKN